MTNSEKANIILQEIEYYLQFDTLQREYAEKGILKALSKIERIEKNEKEKNDDHPTCNECDFTLSCLWE